MSKTIERLEQRQLRTNIPQFKAGDTVRVHFQVIEGTRRRIQVFEGIVIKRQGAGARETFTVRKHSFGVGVERTFPLHTPKIEKIDVVQIGDVNRAKLYYLREKVGKKARVRAVQRRPGVSSAGAASRAAGEAEPDQAAGREPDRARGRVRGRGRGSAGDASEPERADAGDAGGASGPAGGAGGASGPGGGAGGASEPAGDAREPAGEAPEPANAKAR